ncbi:MAG: hypothetical protein ACRDI2_12095, partial [Chloroflexota bacterium]
DARWCHARVTCAGEREGQNEGRDARPADVHEGRYASGPVAGDGIVATYGFDAGATGIVESMQSDDGGGSEYLRWEVGGTGGTLAFWSRLDSPVYFCPRPYPLPDCPAEWQRFQPEGVPLQAGRSGLHPANQTLVRDLLAAVEENRAPTASGHDARAALEMVLAAYESHITGGRVALPLQARTHPLTRWLTEARPKEHEGSE